MKPYLPTRLLLVGFVLLAGMLLTGSATAAPPAIEPALGQSLSLPSTMSGCWEHEIFIAGTAAPLAAPSN